MDHKKVQTTLDHIRKIYGKILDNSSRSAVIPAAVKQVEVTKERYQRAKANNTLASTPITWGYTIDHDLPLRFITSPVRNLELHVDVYCDVQWTEGDMPFKQNIVVRIWSEDQDTIFDPEKDAEETLKKLVSFNPQRPKRVMSRFHFDTDDRKKGSTRAYHPEYHIQFGGMARDYEVCWHSEKLDVPRLIYPPMELFLVCQMIAANFYPDHYLSIKQKSEWRLELKQYQTLILLDHYKKCVKIIESGESLLDTLIIS